MSDEKEKWMEDVFHSMKGSHPAKLTSALFSDIEDRIDFSIKEISLHQWKYTAAAAIFILLVNITALIYHSQSKSIDTAKASMESSYKELLISSFQIYE